MASSILVVFHKDCTASTNLVVRASKLQNYSIEYLDVKTDKFESDLDIDVVPLIIIDNKEIFKGKAAFDKIEELSKTPAKKEKTSSLKYDTVNTFIEDSGSKSEKIDLDAGRKAR
jgi:hypothetical protein